MVLLGGVYLPCIIGLLPDKRRETYDVFFGLIHAYLDAHQLPNTFADGFFMTDFEINIRSAFAMLMVIQVQDFRESMRRWTT